MIFFNSIVLAVYDYSDRDSETTANQILDIIGKVFTAIFVMELLIKIFAQGLFIHQRSYLRDWWNIIDLTVVVSG
jgi:Ion transport protein